MSTFGYFVEPIIEAVYGVRQLRDDSKASFDEALGLSTSQIVKPVSYPMFSYSRTYGNRLNCMKISRIPPIASVSIQDSRRSTMILPHNAHSLSCLPILLVT